MIDLNSTATRRHAFSDAIQERIDRAIENEAEPPRNYIGASAVGDECARRVQLDVWRGFWPDDPDPACDPWPGALKRVFQRGRRLETAMAEWMRLAGFDLRTVKENGYPFGFATGNGQIRGHVDGVISDGDVRPYVHFDGAPTFPMIWENKVVNNKGWRAVHKHGVLRHYPKYDAQAQLYMAYMDLPATLFTFLNADTCEIYAELVPIDQARAQAASDRAVRILQATRAKDLLPRAAADGDTFPCSLCRYRKACWG